jgi:predicted negative regulator of RcsB-dependent stress response
VARKPEHEQSHVIEEIESFAERGAQWIRDHLPLTISVLLVAVGAAAALSAMAAHQAREAETASDAFDQVTTEFMQAMGADPGALTVPELASPAAAMAIRSQFSEQFGDIAETYAGTVAAALARLEQGNMAVAAGDTDAAIEAWQGAFADLEGNPNFQAIVEQRIGQAHEDESRWLEAAESYERAGAVEGYPLRHWALADAARCLQQVGEIERAREIALKLAADAPELALPEHLSAMLEELRHTSAP